MNFYTPTAEYTDSKISEMAKATMHRIMQPNKKQRVETGPKESFTPYSRPGNNQFHINEPLVNNVQGAVKPTYGKSATSKERIHLTDKRHVFVQCQRWGLKTYICIRDYYQNEEAGEFKASRKGINLTIKQWHNLLQRAEDIKEMIGELNGYDECGIDANDNGNTSKDNVETKAEINKSNYTSEHYNWLNHLEEIDCDCLDH